MNYTLIAFGGLMVCGAIYQVVSKAKDTQGALKGIFEMLAIAFGAAFVASLFL